jgi:diguanylate cyclase (GGDEF)-like protein
MFRPRQPKVSGADPGTNLSLTPSQQSAERLAGAVTALAALAALAVALAFPAAYFLSAVNRLIGVTEIRARIYSDQVTDAASQNPEFWNAFFSDSSVDLAGLAIAAPDDAQTPSVEAERRRVIGGHGQILLDVPPARKILWPVVRVTMPVVQNGSRLGEVDVTRSLRPAMVTTLAIGAASSVLGLLLVITLRIVPLRLMRQALDRAAYLSAHDHLTGLPNRRLLADRLQQAILAADRTGIEFALLGLDLDHFKEVNDSLGHAAGDALLQTISSRLRTCLRDSDTLARTGGDEFSIIQLGIRQPQDAAVLATRLIDAVTEPVPLDGQVVFVGLSVGITLRSPGVSGAELSKQADVALYEAKAAGRGCYCFFAPDMDAALQRRRAIEQDLRAALAKAELEVHYQPQVDVGSERIVGAEALMRWHRSGNGTVSPAEFIPIAEESGLIVPLGAWILGQACQEAAKWPAQMHVAVNVSPVQIRAAGFMDTIRCVLRESGLDAQRLELEITEGVLLHNTVQTCGVLAELRDLGVRLAIDDYGIGHSSIGYLQDFLFDKIKIDRSFVANLGIDGKASAIVHAIIALCDVLGLRVCAEGVETRTQFDILRALGCHEFQGFLYSPAVRADQLLSLVSGTQGHEVVTPA